MHTVSRCLAMFSLAALLVAPPTLAFEPPPGDYELGAALGMSVFGQEDHAPPICCGERDSWTVVGPRLGINAAWLPSERFRLALHADFFSGGTTSRGDKRDVATFGNRVAFDVRFGGPRKIRFHAGAEAGFDMVFGSFGDGKDRFDRSEFLFLFGIHSGATYPLTRQLGVGLDFRYVRGFANYRFDGVATVTWSL